MVWLWQTQPLWGQRKEEGVHDADRTTPYRMNKGTSLAKETKTKNQSKQKDAVTDHH